MFWFFISHRVQIAIVGWQIDRAVRSGLHPAEARVQSRAHHHTQVAAARHPRPARQAALPRAAQAGRHRAAEGGTGSGETDVKCLQRQLATVIQGYVQRHLVIKIKVLYTPPSSGRFERFIQRHLVAGVKVLCTLPASEGSIV